MAGAVSLRAQTLDAFHPEPSNYPTSAASAVDGKLLLGGQFTSISGVGRSRIARLSPNGTVDSVYNSGVNAGVQVTAIAMLRDGSTLIGGNFSQVGGQAHANLARFAADGSVDQTFVTGTNGPVTALAVQADGKILVGGDFSTIGGEGRTRIARLNTDGTVDTSFTVSANDDVLTMLVQADGRVVIAGRFTDINGTLRNRIARVSATGELDATFDPDSNGLITGLAQQPDGKFLVVGEFTSMAGASRRRGVRFNADGTVDNTFAPPVNSVLVSMAAQADGKILASGIFSDPGFSGSGIIRLNDDGTLDTTFTPVTSDLPGHVVLDGTGHFYAAGGFTTFMGEARRYIARVTNPTEATQSLEIDGTGQITWELGGSMPVPSIVHLETSADGTAWADLGRAEYTNGIWTLTAASIPAGTTRVRAFGLVPTNGSDSSSIEGLAVLSSNGSPTITANPDDEAVAAGSDLVLTVAATGTGTLAYQWRRDGEDIAGATSATLTIPSAQVWHEGTYTVLVSNEIASVESAGAVVTVAAADASNARLLNLSTRGLVGTGANVMIPGFVVQGTGMKRVLIRAVGPTLTQFNINGALPDPQMTLRRWDAASNNYVDVASNNEWGANTNAADITAVGTSVGAFTLGDAHEAALLVDLEPGQYTVVASGVNEGTGIGIVELYDADDDATTTSLVNLSNRGFAGLGEQVMIPGFVISSAGSKTVLIRVVGPTLGSKFSVPDVMADPKLTLYRQDSATEQTTLLEQDNWGEHPDTARTATIAEQVGAFSLVDGSGDAAAVVTLSPGIYTVVGSSAVADATGVVLVEVYIVQ